ncbi:hypothetical protein ACJJTC_003137 [Scirpophaga incertulas]
MNSELIVQVTSEVHKLVPSSVSCNLSCFVFYDNHPCDDFFFDVCVCTKTGELVEYYKREVVCSINLHTKIAPKSLTILRNSNSLMFYLVETGDEILILSRKTDISVHNRVSNVERYEFNDISCRGQAYLKIYSKDDAVPMMFDDEFQNLEDKAQILNSLNGNDTFPVITHLMVKLTETMYSIKSNETALEEFKKLRQMSALSLYNKVGPSNRESVFKEGMNEMETNNTFDLKSYTPWVKMCNKKIIIMLTLSYTGEELIEDIHMLLHGTSRVSIIYKTRVFEKTILAPFWNEKSNRISQSSCDIAITAVISFAEIKHIVTNKIEFNGAIVYKKSGKEELVPFDYVCISGEEFLRQEYDVLNSSYLDAMTCLAVLASTTRTDMVFRHIRNSDENSVEMAELFSKHLHMTTVQDTNNIVIHNSSPYHILNGVMLVFHKDERNSDIYNVSVYVRTSSQITMLMYYVHQIIPHQIVITTENQKISLKQESLAIYNEDLKFHLPVIDYTEYALSLIQQGHIIIKYLDNCMIKMSDSKKVADINKIGTEIDVFVQGIPKFLEFRQNLLDTAYKGIKKFELTNFRLYHVI